MSKTSATIFYLLVVLAYATAANVTKCYSCNSLVNEDCGDPFKADSTSVECASATYNEKGPIFDLQKTLTQDRADESFNYFCMKHVAETGDKTNINRMCLMVPNSVSNPCSIATKADPKVECHYCSEDNCNSGALYQASAVLLGIILFLASAF